MTGGLTAALITAVAGFLAAIRWVSAKPADYGGPIVAARRRGHAPRGMMFSLLRGIDMVALVTLPIVFGLPAWVSLGIAAIAFEGPSRWLRQGADDGATGVEAAPGRGEGQARSSQGRQDQGAAKEVTPAEEVSRPGRAPATSAGAWRASQRVRPRAPSRQRSRNRRTTGCGRALPGGSDRREAPVPIRRRPLRRPIPTGPA